MPKFKVYITGMAVVSQSQKTKMREGSILMQIKTNLIMLEFGEHMALL